MRLRILPALSLAALAACGGGDKTDEPTSEPFDSTTPASAGATPGAGTVDAVNQRLDQAERDAAARDAEAAEQLRQAGGAGADSL